MPNTSVILYCQVEEAYLVCYLAKMRMPPRLLFFQVEDAYLICYLAKLRMPTSYVFCKLRLPTSPAILPSWQYLPIYYPSWKCLPHLLYCQVEDAYLSSFNFYIAKLRVPTLCQVEEAWFFCDFAKLMMHTWSAILPSWGCIIRLLFCQVEDAQFVCYFDKLRMHTSSVILPSWEYLPHLLSCTSSCWEPWGPWSPLALHTWPASSGPLNI